jgi:hypothetical protein
VKVIRTWSLSTGVIPPFFYVCVRFRTDLNPNNVIHYQFSLN